MVMALAVKILRHLKYGSDMKKMIKIETKRAFLNRNYVFSIIVGVMITGAHFLQNVLPASGMLDNYLCGKGEYPVSLFNTWIGGSGHTFQPALFFMILPIICCIPFSDSYFVDKATGYQIHILTRTNPRDYYIGKTVAVYLSGGTAVMIPLLLNFIATATVVPALVPEASSRTFSIFEHSMWGLVFYTDPLWYILGYFILIFMYSGLIALVGIAASFYLKNRYLVLLFPFIVYTMANFILSYMGKHKYSPELFLRPDQPAGAAFHYICYLYIVILLCLFIVIMCKGRKSEIY